MTKGFVETKIFTKRWFDLGLTDDDLLVLQIYLMQNPDIGDIMEGTGGARKIRFALPDKGKSGGIRAIYVDIIKDEKVYLLLCYPKSKQDNLTDEQKKQLKALIKAIKEDSHG